MDTMAFAPPGGWARLGARATPPCRLRVGSRPPLPARAISCRPARFTASAAAAGSPPAAAAKPPAGPLPAAPTATASLATPASTWTAAAAAGAAKAALPTVKALLLSVAGGAYLALGGLLALSVGGACPGLAAAQPGLAKLLFGVVGLPAGLTLVIVMGAELFTGNVAIIGAAALAGRTTWATVARSWALAYAGNFVGALAVVALVAAAGTLTGPAAASAVAVAGAKAGLAFWPAFWRGVGCNWLVCLAVWMAVGARDFVGKAGATFLTVPAFIVMGFENSVANMFFIPMGMAVGAPVGVRALLLGNLLPVTLGNIVGGLVLVAALAWAAHGR